MEAWNKLSQFGKDVPILSDSDFDDSHVPELLGSGSYGLVQTVSYRGSICAAKHIHSTLLQGVSEQERERIIRNYLRECQCCKQINHPNVVEFYGVRCPPDHCSGRAHNGLPAHIPVMIMELMDKNLSSFISEERSMEIPLDIKHSILFDVATGLSYLHQLEPSPMIHRDLTPNNILLKHNPSERKKLWIAKIGDLGVAKVIRVDSNLKQTRTPGTPDFMPPEAQADNPEYTTSLDVFSYGGVMLFVATHEWPSPEKPMDSSSSEVERRKRYLNKMGEGMKLFRPLVVACLNDDPNKRPTMKDVLHKMTELKKDYVMFEVIEPVTQPKRSLRSSGASKDDLELVSNAKLPPTLPHYTDSDWYVGCISSSEADKMLKDVFGGTYFVREKKEDKKNYEICIKYKKPYHIDISINGHFSITEEKMFTTINDLIRYYQEHSLVHSFPSIDTKLKCPYYVILGSPRKPVKSPWSGIPHSLPVKAVNLAGKRPNTPDVHRKKSRFGRFANVFQRKQSHKIPLEEELWYHGEILRIEAEQLVKNDGDFLVRYSSNQERHVVTVMCDSEPKHIIITKMRYQGEYAYVFHGSEAFPSVAALLTHHIEKQIPVPEHDKIYLKQPVCKQVTVNEEHPISHDCIIFDEKPIEVERSGCIYFGTLKHSSERVIIKTCYSNQFNDQQQFLQEANILRQLNNSNIVKLLSVCDARKPVYIVLEMMQGNFLQFLRELRDNLTSYQLTSFLLDAAIGMEYLTSKNFIHRNLSARSCMIKLDGSTLKIFDFSMCTKVENKLYVMEAAEQSYIAVRWAAPEVFSLSVYTSACDVWSYGVLMYEAYSYGETPFNELNDQDILKKVQQGRRMDPPEVTPKAVCKEVMLPCWDILPKQRPSFQDIVVELRGILAKLPKRT